MSNFLILKSDLGHIKCLKEESEHLVVNDMKSVITGDPNAKRKMPAASSRGSTASQSQSGAPNDMNSDTNSSSIISDTSSVYSSASAILDSISSIFSIRSATNSTSGMPKQKATPSAPF